MKKSIDGYFQKAKDWSDDVYLEAIGSRNRYRFAFLWSLMIISLLIVSFVLLLPLQHTQLVLVHHMNDGTIWIEQPSQQRLVVSNAQIESDIVRYVINRESYTPSSYDYHYSLINLLSSDKVAKEYQRSQSVDNPDSPINQFKKRINRYVHVQNIIYLNKDKQHPLAQVNFTITDRNVVTGYKKRQSLLALISWQYRGTPKNPTAKWLDWDGFMVTDYSIQQRGL